jgi:hypothetical protein
MARAYVANGYLYVPGGLHELKAFLTDEGAPFDPEDWIKFEDKHRCNLCEIDKVWAVIWAAKYS